MNTHTTQDKGNDKRAAAIAPAHLNAGNDPTFRFADHRPEATVQRKLQEMANNAVSQQAPPLQRKANKTGLPDNLKSGIENLSGLSMDDVRVHRNSAKPAQLNAHAYAQGTDIHLASGQEKHLPHEAWHVVQQKQGRVKPTVQMRGKVQVNDDVGLEREADLMGGKALNLVPKQTNESLPGGPTLIPKTDELQRQVIQRKGIYGDLRKNGWVVSGSMARYDLEDQWHASIFRVTSAGESSKSGLFFDGFHLTNELYDKKKQPHVFFTHEGMLEKDISLDHNKSKAFEEAHGNQALNKQIVTANGLAKIIPGTLGENLESSAEQELEAADLFEKQEKLNLIAAQDAALVLAAAEQTAAMAQSDLEDDQLKLFLKDCGLGLGYLESFKDNLLGKADAANSGVLKPLAEWYNTKKKSGWKVEVKVRNRNKVQDFDKRQGAEMSISKTKSGRKGWNHTATYKYPSYGRYKYAEGADLPPTL